MTLGEHLIAIAEAGIAFSGAETKDSALTILLDVENILDKGRGFATPDERKEINEKMDQIRGTIRNVLDAMPGDEAREFMASRGREAQNQFSIEETVRAT